MAHTFCYISSPQVLHLCYILKSQLQAKVNPKIVTFVLHSSAAADPKISLYGRKVQKSAH